MAEQNEEIEDNTLLTELGEAWDEHESEEPEEVAEEQEPIGEEEPAEESAEEPAEEPEPIEAAEDAPPVGLPPEAREAWKDTPQAMKDALTQREKQFSAGIQKYAEGAKRAEGMDRTLQPYQQYLAMNGGAKHIGTLLQTGAGLQMGSPAQKAQTIAALIQQYGVDISTLDGLLVGNAPPQATAEQQQLQQLQQRFDQQDQMQRQQQQYRQQQDQNRVVSEVEAFSMDGNNEFYRDVSADMADLMEMAANRNQPMNMKEAYDRACQMNPSVSAVIGSRTNASQVAAKRQAAKSISGSPGGPGGKPQANDLHSALSDAWDNAGRM